MARSVTDGSSDSDSISDESTLLFMSTPDSLAHLGKEQSGRLKVNAAICVLFTSLAGGSSRGFLTRHHLRDAILFRRPDGDCVYLGVFSDGMPLPSVPKNRRGSCMALSE